ncbi:porin [Massilia eurypsychrophila]|uniref:Porin n=1 Tax=Massilia eurypsychrophila TaxID=1485217 RepID=A0A2G8T8Q2_9BURK|nr:porin [Massilia eurypsychrophila]PIL42446.1 porin [Massilia eurypsychrophila]
MNTLNFLRFGAGLIAAGTSFGALAQAGTQVQLYGLVGAYAGKLERSGGPAATTVIGHGGLTTSFWGFRGSEDLGSGNKVIFALESFFQTDTGAQGRSAADPLFSRNAYVGVEGSFGKLTVGRQTNPTYINMGMLSPFGSSVVFSPLVLQSFVGTYNGALIGDTVWNNAVQYVTPRTNGFAANVIYGLGEVAGSSSTANLGLHANYLKGNFSAAFSAQRVRVPVIAPLTQQEGYLLGAAYDFRVAKVYGSVVKSEASGVVNGTRGWDVGLKVPVTAQGALLAEYGNTKRTRAALADNVRKTASIGYDHVLSKRTDVYAIYLRDKQTGFDSTDSMALGIRHTF